MSVLIDVKSIVGLAALLPERDCYAHNSIKCKNPVFELQVHKRLSGKLKKRIIKTLTFSVIKRVSFSNSPASLY